ncbi:hypothetical protein M9458_006694, partial [Cirrhinus mrigala]
VPVPLLAVTSSQSGLPIRRCQSGHCGHRCKRAPALTLQEHPASAYLQACRIGPTHPGRSPSRPDKRPVDQITRDLPPVKPMRMEFAKAPRTLGRSMSQEAQRG